MIRETMCDSCMSPGACCKRLFLTGGRLGFRFEQPMTREVAEHEAMRQGLPFVPADSENGIWRWTCPALQDDGRCGIYESRPEVCRRYEPGRDPLCVHYWPRPNPISDLLAEAEALEADHESLTCPATPEKD